MRARQMVSIVAVTTSLAMVAASMSSSAASPNMTVATDSEVQAAFIDTLEELKTSVSSMAADPTLAVILEDAGVADLEASIDHAIELTEELTETELDSLEQVLDSHQFVEELPSAIDDVVDVAEEGVERAELNGVVDEEAEGLVSFASFTAAAQTTAPRVALLAVSGSATFTDNCATAGDAETANNVAFGLNLLQSTAYAAVISTPDTISLFFFSVPFPLNIVLAVLYGVALAAYLAAAQVAAVALDCEQTAFSDTQVSTLPVAATTSVNPPPGTNVAGSSQISVDQAISDIGDVNAQMNTLETNIGLVTSQVATLTDATADLNTTLSCTSGFPTRPDPPCTVDGSDVDARSTELLGDIQELQGNVAILRNTQMGVLDKANDEIAALDAFEQLQLRMEIETSLSVNGNHAVAAFQLPAPWGYLDTVRSIVTDTVDQFGRGGGDLAAANAAYDAGRYKDAYASYQKAYQGATR